MAEGRRLPIYLLLDCSGSMSGQPIEAVRMGVKQLLADLRTDPQALETAYLSVITFDSTARQVAPLADLMSFAEPALNASGSTALGDALQVLEHCFDTELQKSSSTQKGDWRPLVFLMTDGQPTDSWEAAADRIRQKKPGNIIACAAGPGADETMLKRITEVVIKLDSLAPEMLKAFFKWVTQSIKMTSASVHTVAGGDAAPVTLPPPPPGIVVVP